METMKFDRELEEATAMAERILKSHLPAEEGAQKQVIEAMNYSLTAGGKRLRPVLMWEAFRMCGGSGEEIVGCFMAAIEMIHTYSLVHDDLPAMDNDRYRRGRETTWYVYGDAMGILAGDGLLNYAFETALKSAKYCFKNDDIANYGDSDAEKFQEKLKRLQRIWHALSVLAQKAGIHGMIGGQAVDIMAEGQIAVVGKNPEDAVEKAEYPGREASGKVGSDASAAERIFEKSGNDVVHVAETDSGAGRNAHTVENGSGNAAHDRNAAEKDAEQQLMFIHEHKTAALIQAAMMVGGILAGASEEQISKIEKCAYNIGIAFQIQDDILDVTGDSKELGKATGSDALNQKQTYVTLKGLEQAGKDVEALSREAADLLDEFEGEHEFLKELILHLIYRRK